MLFQALFCRLVINLSLHSYSTIIIDVLIALLQPCSCRRWKYQTQTPNIRRADQRLHSSSEEKKKQKQKAAKKKLLLEKGGYIARSLIIFCTLKMLKSSAGGGAGRRDPSSQTPVIKKKKRSNSFSGLSIFNLGNSKGEAPVSEPSAPKSPSVRRRHLTPLSSPVASRSSCLVTGPLPSDPPSLGMMAASPVEDAQRRFPFLPRLSNREPGGSSGRSKRKSKEEPSLSR